MESEEKDHLLVDVREDNPSITSGYGTDPRELGDKQRSSSSTTEEDEEEDEDTQEPSFPASADSQTRRPWWKREKKPKGNQLDKVDEDSEQQEKPVKEVRKKKSKGRMFGVKSYLHHFYDGNADKDPNIFEADDDFSYLLGKPKGRRCTSVWWKVFVWIGANFLIFGIIGVLVGYLVPQRPLIVGKLTDHVYVSDQSALNFNFNLDVCKLVGLVLFCVGGLTLAVALLFPSFLYQYCDDDRREAAFKVQFGKDHPQARSPLEMQIPSSSLISGIQPDRKTKESIATKSGMLSFSD